MPIFRTRHQAELLACLFLRPAEEFKFPELTRQLDMASTPLRAEVDRLVGAGLIQESYVGESQTWRANRDALAASPLTELLSLSFGPQVVLNEEFHQLGRVHMVLIYGPWALLHVGQPCQESTSIDVLVIGAPDPEQVHIAAGQAEKRLGMEISATVRSLEVWREGTDPLIRIARDQHVVVVKGGPT